MTDYNDIIQHRTDFPSLKRIHNGTPLIYLDGPGGTQVPQPVIDTMVHYYTNCNANTHGYFVTTMESDQIIHETRKVTADFLGAAHDWEISFGANMTTLNYALARAIGRYLKPGDEILITQLDHEANRGPWLSLRELGIVVREINILPDCTLDYDDLQRKVNESTRLIAMGWASNAFGTVNNVELVRKLSYQVGAWLLLDAVHYAPHFPIDVKNTGSDFLLCSAYKFYGPHVGILYSRHGILDRLETDRLRTQDQRAPYRIETGTLNHAALAGVKAAVEYIATFGQGPSLREKIIHAMTRIAEYEHHLARYLYKGLKPIKKLTVYGLPFNDKHRTPTLSFTIEGKTPVEICTCLDQRSICAWDGHFYAIRPVEVLGLLEKGGVTRLGVSLYNTKEEMDRVIEAIKFIAKE